MHCFRRVGIYCHFALTWTGIATDLNPRYVFAKFNESLKDTDQSPYNSDEKVQSQLKTIPTFLALFIFGFLYELVLVWDALRVKNTIQVIGICIANLALMVYTSIQVDQIREAVDILITQNAVQDLTVWNDVQGILIAIPCVIGVGTICYSFVAWKLYQEFAWDILKHIGADYRMKKRFLHYQVCTNIIIDKTPAVSLIYSADLHRSFEV